ncbi:MAG TPA: hypothetical protein ENF39_01710 [Candidatus Aenigmarchaeota archaeon]|nr:MAG: hypothetical protein DRP14_02005 [Candidatus Aenigmarchaeota archaeon]HDI06704.1 hypothetical protein [Candidatus Aenigmarchaeota archaeon]
MAKYLLNLINKRFMGSKKTLEKKLKLISVSKRPAPRWADIKKFGLKRARTRRIRTNTKNWRRSKYKI